MRHKLPHPGDERIVTKFLWLPKTIDRELRWLERVTYKQILKHRIGMLFDSYEWIDWEWIK